MTEFIISSLMTWPGSSFHSPAGRQTRHEGFHVSFTFTFTRRTAMSTIVLSAQPRRSVPPHSSRTGSHRHHSASVSVLQASLIAIHFPISTINFPTIYQIGTPSSQEAPSHMDNVLQHLRTWLSSTSSSFQLIHATDNSLVDKYRIGH